MSRLREKEGVESLKTNYAKIDILAPQFYTITSKMGITGSVSSEIKKIASDNKIEIMPLIANEGFNQNVMHKLLISEKAQDDIITGLIYLAKKSNYVGWQFDFENINYKDKDLYSQFVEKTAKILHENGFILSVAAVVRATDYEDTSFFKNWSGAFDYKRIADAVDFVSVMTYDDPDSKGPVASLEFVKSSLEYLKDKIPSNKLSMGIPLYYWGWAADPLAKVRYDGTYQRLSLVKQAFQYVTYFFENLGTSALVYFNKNKAYIIWYDGENGFKAKINIVKESGFRGFSAWVLGIEDPAIWKNL